MIEDCYMRHYAVLENISLIFSINSEENASQFLENLTYRYCHRQNNALQYLLKRTYNHLSVGLLTDINNIASRFSSYSEADASESLENRK